MILMVYICIYIGRRILGFFGFFFSEKIFLEKIFFVKSGEKNVKKGEKM